MGARTVRGGWPGREGSEGRSLGLRRGLAKASTDWAIRDATGRAEVIAVRLHGVGRAEQPVDLVSLPGTSSWETLCETVDCARPDGAECARPTARPAMSVLVWSWV